MSSRMSSGPSPAGEPAVGRTPQAGTRFLQMLSEGMHALVQPLAVAQGNLELVQFRGKTLEEFQQAVEESLVQMSRGMELLNYVHELIRIARMPGEQKAVPVAEPLATVREDLRCVWDVAGIGCVVQMADPELALLGSAERLRQLFLYLLQAAGMGLAAGDKIRVEVGEASAPANRAALEITASGRGETTLRPETRRSLALAEAIVASLSGEFECRTSPFAVRLQLPVAAAAKKGSNRRRDARQK